MKKYKNSIQAELSEFLRDFSGFGNILILVAIYSLLFRGSQLVLIIGGLALTLVICYIIKAAFHRHRPLRLDFTNIVEKIQSGSFPSAHSAEAMYTGLLVIFHVNSPVAQIIFGIIILIVGYSRFHLKRHYLRDVMGGYVIGLAVFLLIIAALA